ncbi:FtsQ-type POTRA domain-containing protein [uncultured Desulfovibrio sp.]|uniref:FtsQ-type POTRA domain-containing protein n=1 Tax=Candidatus Desulfovibrio intestinavium TaxID=2838534 RepID=A0A9D2HLI5_9BACT|nr:FtsQ-type POTRA domain-containing protein [uncultured Desulfovibrio sp.]HJA78941.1 FtsQ-type POTRA domain-containing protein [Candidatus Desulfovibrio intestinavium]
MSLSLKRKKQARNSYRKEKASRWAALRTLRLPLPRWQMSRGGLVNILTICALLIFVAVVVTGVCSLSLWLYGKATTSDFFATTHIDVTGNVRLSRDMVLKYGGLSEGDNSLAVSITELERKLRATPWVEEVSVKRLLPDRFIIRIKERMPSFWVHKDGVLYYANERGELIAPVESENFLSLPTLSVESGGEDAIPFLGRLMEDLNSGSLPVESGAIASVTLSPARGVEVYLEDREMRLSIAIDDWSGNLARLGATLGDLARRQELRNVRDVRAVHGNVWVILNENVQG